MCAEAVTPERRKSSDDSMSAEAERDEAAVLPPAQLSCS